MGQEKIEGFASATEFDDELIDGLRFILERKSGLLSQEKMQFFAAGGGHKEAGISGRQAGCSAAVPEGLSDHLEHQCRGDNQEGRQFLIRSIE